ncbi:uncharacterized protein LTR77_004742 [Saxophila tyrrhenica]|uniref:BTB domain-containing protein n=1 Tax=Saxophila tyrrhenica TaxID=1690608 RepID=A0AAV9P9Y4_9PEZI|nr:hypothetical protein LTR77_004742 [Saxophila tyrrhenica]
MAPTYVDLLSGPTFTFEVQGQSFTVHRGFVAKVSKPLEAVMENGMQESENGMAPLKDVDKATFGRFMEFAYTGDYQPAHAVAVSRAETEFDSVNGKHEDMVEPGTGDTNRSENVPVEEVAFEEAPFEESGPSEHNRDIDAALFGLLRNRSMVRKVKKASSMHYDQRTGTLSIMKAKRAARSTEDMVTNSRLPTSSAFVLGDYCTAEYDCLPIFLSHAQLYIFADYYAVFSLKSLAARRLEEALSVREERALSLTDVVALTKFVYDNTPEKEEGLDELRLVVTEFAAKNVTALRHADRFDDEPRWNRSDSLIDLRVNLYRIKTSTNLLSSAHTTSDRLGRTRGLAIRHEHVSLCHQHAWAAPICLLEQISSPGLEHFKHISLNSSSLCRAT